MLQEAKGTNGRILGSLNYFSLINEKFPQKSLLKDRTKANYFAWLGNSILKVKKILESIDGKKIQAFFQFAVNTICLDIKKSVAKGEFADFEHRENLRNALKQLEKCGYKVPSTIYDEIKKLRRLEDFHKKIINLNFKGAQYPVEVWLEWKNGKNILHIHVKVCFEGVANESYLERDNPKKYYILKGFEKWTGHYKIFNSAEEGKQDITVLCTTEEVEKSSSNKSLLVVVEKDTEARRSLSETPTNWSQTNLSKSIHMYSHQINTKTGEPFPLSAGRYADGAKHELGHALGLEDAYTAKDTNYDENYADIKEDLQMAAGERDKKNKVNMVMNNSTGPVLNNDIEMLILAWQSGKRQYFHLDNGGEEISEALGR